MLNQFTVKWSITSAITGMLVGCSGASDHQRSQLRSDAQLSGHSTNDVAKKGYMLTDNPPTKRLGFLKHLHPGDSLMTCRQKIGKPEVNSTEIIAKFPQVSFLPPEATVAWVLEEHSPVSSKVYLFARFDDSRMTNLVDLIELNRGAKFPRLRGLYQQALERIKPGSSVESLFDSCGSATCEYFRGGNGGWKVRFSYVGHGRDIFVFEADAGTGEIDKAYVSVL